MKKIICLLLTFAMLATIVPAAAFAEETGMERVAVAAETPSGIVVDDGDLHYTINEGDGLVYVESDTGRFDGGSGAVASYLDSIYRIEFGESVKIIGSMAFECFFGSKNAVINDKKLTVVISKNISEIEGYAFCRCSNISLELEDGNTNFKLIDGVLYSFDMEKLIYASPILTGDFTVPETVTTVCDGAFVCSRFDSVTIPDTVTSMISASGDGQMDGRIFTYTNIKKIVIGENVAELTNCAFYRCENLEELIINGKNTVLEDALISNDIGTVYVQRNSNAEKYMKDYYDGHWSYIESREGKANITGTVILPGGKPLSVPLKVKVYIKSIDGGYGELCDNLYIPAGQTSASYSLWVTNGERIYEMWAETVDDVDGIAKRNYWNYNGETVIYNPYINKLVTGDTEMNFELLRGSVISGTVSFEEYADASDDLKITVCARNVNTGECYYDVVYAHEGLYGATKFGVSIPKSEDDIYILSATAEKTAEDMKTDASCGVEYFCNLKENGGVSSREYMAMNICSNTLEESYDLTIPNKKTIPFELSFGNGSFIVPSSIGEGLNVIVTAQSVETEIEYLKSLNVMSAQSSISGEIDVPADCEYETFKLRVIATDNYTGSVKTNLSLNSYYYFSGDGMTENIDNAKAVSPSDGICKLTVPGEIEIPVTLAFEENTVLVGDEICDIQLYELQECDNGEYERIYIADKSVQLSQSGDNTAKIALPQGSYSNGIYISFYIRGNQEKTNLLLNRTYFVGQFEPSTMDTRAYAFDVGKIAAEGLTITLPKQKTISGRLIMPSDYVESGKIKEADFSLLEYVDTDEYRTVMSTYVEFENGDYSFNFPVKEDVKEGKYILAVYPYNFDGNVVKREYFLMDSSGNNYKYIDVSNNYSGLEIPLEGGYIVSGEIAIPSGVTLSSTNNAGFGIVAWNTDLETEEGESFLSAAPEGDYSSYMESIEGNKRSFPFSVAVPKNTNIILAARGSADRESNLLYDGYTFYVSNSDSTAIEGEAKTLSVGGNMSGIKIMLMESGTLACTINRPEGIYSQPYAKLRMETEDGKQIGGDEFFGMWSSVVQETFSVPKKHKKIYISYELSKEESSTQDSRLYWGRVYINPDGSYATSRSEAQLWNLEENSTKVFFTIATKEDIENKDGNTVFYFKDSVSQSGEAITNAKMIITSEDGTTEKTVSADNAGEARLTLENGIYSVCAYAEGFGVRNFVIEKTDTNNEFTVFMSRESILDVQTTVKEMTRDEIEAAGIDFSAPENNHVYNCTAVLEFSPTEKVSINYICNDTAVIKSEPIHSGNKTIYAAAKDIYLIIHSNVTWLKEMFDVQLIAANTSQFEIINNCTANLSLPDGLSLAVMANEQQTPSIDLGSIAPSSRKDVHWYVKGDKKGEYTLSGTVSGTRIGGGISEAINANFKTKEPINVLAGDALKLTIEAENKATVGKPYKVYFTLQNVSQKTLYNVALNILGGAFCTEYSVDDLVFDAESSSGITGNMQNGFSVKNDNLASGGVLSGTFEITFGKEIDTEENINYMLKSMFVITTAGSTAEIPTEIKLVDSVVKHNWDSGTVTKAETCTENGIRTYRCTDSGCTAEKTEEIIAKGHNMTEWAVDKAATCTEAGSRSRRCQNEGCTFSESESIDALGHSFGTEKVIDKAANCTENGSKSYHCARCSEKKDEEIIPASGHNLTEWAVDKAATCTEAGSRSRRCQNEGCTFSENESIDALGHSFGTEKVIDKAANCTESGSKSYHCARCSEKKDEETIPALGHSFDEGTVIKAATETEEGEKLFKCGRCGFEDRRVIPKLVRQALEFATIGDIEITYGQFEFVDNAAYNDSENGGAITFKSSDEEVATVDSRGRATIKNAGETTITATAATAEGYVETSISYALKVNKAALKIKPADREIFYGEEPTFNEIEAEGLVYNEDTSVILGEAEYTTDYEILGAVGSYSINVSGLSARNYNIEFTPGTLTVKKAENYTITLGNLTSRRGSVTAVTAKIEPSDSSAVIKIEYLGENGEWSETLPNEIGEYKVRASLVSADNIQPKESGVAEAVLTVKAGALININGGSAIDINADVNGNKAEFSVSDEALSELENNIPSTGEVVIDAKGSTDGVNELVIPANLVNKLAEAEEADKLTILADDAEITIDKNVLNAAAGKLSEDDKLSLHIESIEEENLNESQRNALSAIGGSGAVVLQLNMVVEHFDGEGNKTDEEIHALGGNVDVRAAYTLPADMIGKRLVVCYVAEDGSVSYVRAKYEDGFVSFRTEHFSNFAILIAPCSHSWNGGTVITPATTTETGIMRYTCTLCRETKDEIIPLVSSGRRTSGGGGGGGSVSSFTVTFETNGADKMNSVKVENGKALAKPAEPIREGFKFAGWFTDKEQTHEYNFDEKVSKSFTLYAKWEKADADNSKNQIILTIGDKNAVVFGKAAANDVAPKIVADRTMLPARFVAEALGATVSWNGDEKLVTIVGKNEKGEDITVLIYIGSDTAYVNGETVKLESPAFLENDRTYTPVRFVAESLGADVDWNNESRQVIITKK